MAKIKKKQIKKPGEYPYNRYSFNNKDLKLECASFCNIFFENNVEIIIKNKKTNKTLIFDTTTLESVLSEIEDNLSFYQKILNLLKEIQENEKSEFSPNSLEGPSKA